MTLLRKRIGLSMILCFSLLATIASAQNHVLSLDGVGSYVRIKNAQKLQGGENVVLTLEAWFMAKKTPFPLVTKTLNPSQKDWAINLDAQGRIQFHATRAGNYRGNDYSPSSSLAIAPNRFSGFTSTGC